MTWLSWCFLISAIAFCIAWLIVLGKNRKAGKILAETSKMLDRQQDLHQKSYEEGKKVGAQLERNRQAGVEMQKLCDVEAVKPPAIGTVKSVQIIDDRTWSVDVDINPDFLGPFMRASMTVRSQDPLLTTKEMYAEIDRVMAIFAPKLKKPEPVITPLRNELPRVYRPFYDPPSAVFNRYGDVIDTRAFERRMLDEPMFPPNFDLKDLETWHSDAGVYTCFAPNIRNPKDFEIRPNKEPDMKFDVNVNAQINGKGEIQVDSALTIDGEVQKISTKLVGLQEKAIATALKDLHYIDPNGAVGLRDRIHDIRHTVADCDLGRTHPRLKEQVNSLTNFFYDAVGEPVPPIRDNMFRDVKYVFSDKDFMAGGAYASTAFASRPCKFQVGDIVQHNKTGGEYEILSIASDSAAAERTVYTYRSLKDQRNWVRLRGEMEDGRFTKVGQFKK